MQGNRDGLPCKKEEVLNLLAYHVGCVGIAGASTTYTRVVETGKEIRVVDIDILVGPAFRDDKAEVLGIAFVFIG